MEKKIFILLMVMFLALFGVTSVSANLLVNGSYEVASPDGWPGGFATYNYSQPYYDGPPPDAVAYPERGDLYGWAPNENGVGTGSTQIVDMTGYAGQSYILSAFLAGYLSDYGFIRLTFNDAADGTGSAVGSPIEFNPFDTSAGGNPAYWIGSINASGLVDASVAHTTRNWSYFEVSDIVPAGALSAVVDWEGHANGAQGSDSWGNDAYIDMINLSLQNAPVLIYPVGEDNQPWDLTLEWLPPSTFTPTGYYIYLDPNEEKVSSQDPTVKLNAVLDTDPNYDVTGLTPGETYYWMVVARQDPVTTPPSDPNWIPSGVATFNTLPETPLFTIQPQDENVIGDGSATAEFTIVALNVDNYKWYKEGDAVTVLSTTDTLTISNVTEADEGFYYCEISNGAGTVVSDSVRLLTKRLLGHWPMDGNANDAVVDLDGPIDGVVAGDPNWPTGILGSAINLDPAHPKSPTDPNMVGIDDYVVLGDANDLNFRTATDFTVSLWVNSDGGWQEDPSIISNKDWNSGGSTGWGIFVHGPAAGDWQWNYRESTSGRLDYDPSDQKVNDSQWHHVCVTHDRDGLATMYFDGEQKATVNISATTGTLDSGYPTVIGADGTFSTVWTYFFKGLVDEVKIWSDVLNSFEVAKLYTDLAGGEVCAETISAKYDRNGDCQVNLLDFAEFADHWLECNLVPTCLP